ncbi:MAG: hypothetical protein EOO21_07075, partial [Comamonadaceae bacterium]
MVVNCETTYTTTSITQQVGTEMVQVGSQFTTMNVTLQQIGYFNPNAVGEAKFREFFIEGVDYLNAGPSVNGIKVVDWTNAGNEENRGAQAAAVNTSDYRLATYKAFSQLDALQKQAVLNALGYMPVYSFSYDSAVLHKTLNGNTTTEAFVPTWASQPLKYYHVDVAGWRDKYVSMPSGAEADILRAVSQGTAQYLLSPAGSSVQNGNTGLAHADVRTAAVTNVDLSAPGATIGGVTMVAGNRFLATAQTTGAQNGIYVWNGAGVAATRATDADAANEVANGSSVYVTEGAVKCVYG